MPAAVWLAGCNKRFGMPPWERCVKERIVKLNLVERFWAWWFSLGCVACDFGGSGIGLWERVDDALLCPACAMAAEARRATCVEKMKRFRCTRAFELVTATSLARWLYLRRPIYRAQRFVGSRVCLRCRGWGTYSYLRYYLLCDECCSEQSFDAWDAARWGDVLRYRGLIWLVVMGGFFYPLWWKVRMRLHALRHRGAVG